jgi:integrase
VSVPRFSDGSPSGEWLQPVLSRLEQDKVLTDHSFDQLSRLIARFQTYLERGHGVTRLRDVGPEHVRGFLLAPSATDAGGAAPMISTQYLRRSAVRLAFRVARQLGIVQTDPSLDIVLPPRSMLVTRPLSDDEVAVCRSSSLRTLRETRQPAAWSLAEATARSTEIGAITVSDVDIDRHRVWIHGGLRTAPRWGELSEWGLRQITRRVHGLGRTEDDAPLVYRGRGDSEEGRGASRDAIWQVLRRAGLTGEPDVRPSSVAAWVGRRLLDDGHPIDEIARRLGLRSLDQAARFIGWDWREGAQT